MMQRISLASVAFVMLAVPALAVENNCKPPPPPSVPDGNTAPAADLAAAATQVKAFIAASDQYQLCLNFLLARQQSEHDQLGDANQKEKIRVGTLYNAAASAYRQQHPAPDGAQADSASTPSAQQSGIETKDGLPEAVAMGPHLITAADYPPVSVRLQEQGTVRIRYVVNEDGFVTNCQVVGSSGKPRLDDAACAMALKRWKFEPLKRDGKPIQNVKTESVIFQLR